MTSVIALILVITVLACLQPSAERREVACAYALVNMGHFLLISWWISDFWYYVSAGIADVVIMSIIVHMHKIPEIGLLLLRACLLELMVNAFGWVLWWRYAPPDAYNALYQCVQIWIVFILMKKGEADEWGGFTVGNWRDFVRLVVSPGYASIQGRDR